MALTLETRQNNKNTAGTSVSAVSGNNNGGLLGGSLYLNEKMALGFLSSVEGIWDYTAGGIAKLFGADKWAERQFANDLVNYNHADEWYDPGKGWQFAGDVAGGIGTSLPAIVAAGVAAKLTVATGGAAAPAAVKLLSLSVAPLVSGLGAAGNATKSAYQKTGELGLKEFGYGAISGATEAAVEGLTARIGTGTGRIVSSLSKRAAGETVSTLGKSGAFSLLKTLGADFASEAVEEGLSEALDPLYQRWTSVDPNAQNASAKEIGYAALVGGLSGVVMSGGAAAFNTTANLFGGERSVKSGTSGDIINTARQIAEYESANDTGYKSFQAIRDAYPQLSASLSSTGGQVSTVRQKMLLGSLKKAETAAFFEPFIERSAMKLLTDADSAAARFSALGMTDASGKALSFTADQIRSGVDASLLAKMQSGTLSGADRKTLTRQLRAAIGTNSVLTSLAVMDATGRISMDTEKFAQAALSGRLIADAADLNRFIETASPAQIENLSKKLKIDNWAALTPDVFQSRVAEFNATEEGQAYRAQMEFVKQAQSIADSESKKLPRLFRSNTVAQGLTHYASADGRVNMALLRDGDRYHLYDYETGNPSRDLTLAEVNSAIRPYWNAQGNTQSTAQAAQDAQKPMEVQTQAQAQESATESATAAQAVRLNMIASENISDWKQLSEPNRAAVRMTMRQAIAAGLDEDTALTFGRVSARSGMNIVFSTEQSGEGDARISGNTIYIDPEADKGRMENKLLLHEAGHALMRERDGARLIARAFETVAPDRSSQIAQKYQKLYQQRGMRMDQYLPIVDEEIATAGIEDTLGDINAWEYILSEEPSFGNKILNFFRKSAQDYSSSAGLSREARKLLNTYKKMFAELSERNRGNNAITLANEVEYGRQDVDYEQIAKGRKSQRVHGERFALPEEAVKINKTANMTAEERQAGVEVADFILSVANMVDRSKISKRKHRIGTLSANNVKIIENLMRVVDKDFSAEGYDLWIDGTGADHIEVRHGANGEANQSMASREAKEMIPWAANTADGGELILDSHGNLELSDRYKNSDNTPSVQIRLYKKINGDTFYVSECVPDNAKKIIYITSAYVKKGSDDQVLKPESNDSGNLTPEAMLGDHATNSRIAQNEPKVNSKSKKSSDERLALPEDKKYIDAVKSGDMDSAQRMVDEAAKKAGYTIKAYHGTPIKGITTFDSKKIGSTTDDGLFGHGFYFTTNKLTADGYATVDGETMPVFLHVENSWWGLGHKVREVADQLGVDDSSLTVRKVGLGSVVAPLTAYSRTFTAHLVENGYDSVIVQHGKRDYEIVVFDNTKIKSADPVTYDDNGNVIPLSERFNADNNDIRYALPEEADSGSDVMPAKNISDIFHRGIVGVPKNPSAGKGRLEKTIANMSGETVFNKTKIVEALAQIPETKDLTDATRDYIAESIWIGVNQKQQDKARAAFAQSVSNYMAAAVVNETKVQRKLNQEEYAKYKKRYKSLRKGIGKIVFSTNEMLAMSRKLNAKELQGLLYAWGVKENEESALSTADFLKQLVEDIPEYAYLSELSIQDAWREVQRLYRDTRKIVRSGQSVQQYAMITRDEFKSMQKYFEESILGIFSTVGQKTKYAKEREELDSLRNYKKTDTIRNQIVKIAGKLRELKIGTFSNATQMESDVFKGSIQKLASIEYRGNLSVTKAKNALRELAAWYTQEQKPLMYVDEQTPGYYNKGIAEMLSELSKTDEPFSKDQLNMLKDVMSYFANFLENYGKIWRHGKYVDAKTEAERYVAQIQENEKLGKNTFDRMMAMRYQVNSGDPHSVVKSKDMYADGFFTEMYEDIRQATLDANVKLMEVMNDYDKFMAEHKRYMRDAAKQDIRWVEEERTNTMPKMMAIGLYMTSKREHAQAGLALNGFKFKDRDGNIIKAGALIRNADPKEVTQAQILEAISELQSRIRKQLSAEDLEYIKILEKGYGQDLRSLKAERDIQRQGFTNVTTGYYYPIRRADIAKSIDVSAFSELDRVSNASFNKSIVEGARGNLFIEDADALFHRHANAVTRYWALQPVIESFNILYNMDVSGNPNNSVSVATTSENQWKGSKEYFRDLIADIQGVPKNTGEFSKELANVRSHVAMSQLGANPKTWVTQFSSLFAASSMLDPTSITKGLAHVSNDVDAYCDLAKLRNYESAAIKAQGVLDKVSSVGEALMKPIAWTDRLVVKILWGACQVQVQRDSKLKIGTEENKVAAGKLLTEVLFETQQNSLATERSAMMRSGNELIRALTMFSADGMKVTGRFLDGIGEVSALKRRLETVSAEERPALEKKLKSARKKSRRATAAMVSSAVFAVAIAECFRWLYAKEREEDENAVLDMTLDFVGNLLGGLPGLRDVYTFFVDGYELDNYAISAVNDLLTSVKSSFSLAYDIVRGEGDTSEIPAKVKNLSYAVSQFFGLPVRNVYNVLSGLTRRVAPQAGYKLDSVFYKKNYRTDLKKAVEEGDARRVSLLMGLINGKDITGQIGEDGMSELNRMALAGYSILPRTIRKTVSINGEEVELDETQVEALNEAYSESWGATMASLLSSSAYASMSDAQKEKAIRMVHDISYERALVSAGIDRGEKSVLIADLIGIEGAAVYYSLTSGIVSDVDKNGKTVEGSRRAKVVSAIRSMNLGREKTLLMICLAGYSLKDGDVRGMKAKSEKVLLLKYIMQLPGKSAAQKAVIAQACGFEVRNGRVLMSSLNGD